MFDHTGIGATDLAATRAFFLEALAAAFVVGPDGHNVEAVCDEPVA